MHTPGPWRVVHTADDQTFIDTEESRETFIAQVDRCIPEYEDNAEFIVRACNNHADLLEALKIAYEWLRNIQKEATDINLLIDTQPYKDKAGLEWFKRTVAKAEGREIRP